MGLESWAGSVDLETPAGRLLRAFAASLPRDWKNEITVFGSAPLQITIDSTLVSADIDLFADSDDLQELVPR